MKKKKLKRRIESLENEIISLKARSGCKYCENYKPKNVQFFRWQPLESIRPFSTDRLDETVPGNKSSEIETDFEEG